MKEESVCLLSLSRHVTPWVFSSLKSSSISHNPTSPRVTWVHSLLYRRETGGQLCFPMASVSLVSSPPAPVLDKNMTDSELAGDERSSNILMQFLIRSSVLWVYMLVLLFLFLYSKSGLAGCRIHGAPHPLQPKIFCMPLFWCCPNSLDYPITVSIRRIHDHFPCRIERADHRFVLLRCCWDRSMVSLLPSAGGFTNLSLTWTPRPSCRCAAP